MAKVTCVSLHVWIFFCFFLNLQGEILHKHILFSCCQWKQKILFKVSLWLVLVEVAVPKTSHGWKNINTVFSRVVFKACGPMAAE